MINKEFNKFIGIGQEIEKKSKKISILKESNLDKEVSIETFQESLKKLSEEIDKSQNKVISNADKQLENIITSSGLSITKALKIFNQGGFAEKIKSIKENINNLSNNFKEKIYSIATEVKSQNKEKYQKESKEQLVERITAALEKLKEQEEKLEKIGLYPKVGILADSKYIENQQIDIIKAKDNEFKIYFKLTKEHYKKILTKYSKNYKSRIVNSILYVDKERSSHFTLTDALRKDVDGAIIRISVGTRNDEKINSALGLVEITIQQDDNTKLTPEQISQKINRILIEELEIEDGLYLPTPESEKEYKMARYKWHHKTEEVPSDIDHRLKREEVAPGYFTFVDEGKHREYQKISRYAVYHAIYSIESLPKIIQAGGLLSSHERYRRGLIVSGLSSYMDFGTGGADSVFTRIITENGLKASGIEDVYLHSTATIVFDNSLLDRTDWYAYGFDRFGSTDPNEFNDRLNPTELLNRLSKSIYDDNEQMFRCGISIDKFKAIVCYNENDALKIRNLLYESGITEINGRSVDEMIIIAKKMIDIVDISEGKLKNVKTVKSLLERPFYTI